MWPNRHLLDLIGIGLPIIQAPLAGANGSAMAIAVSEAGGALAPLKAAAEARGASDFTNLWSGQAAGVRHESGAGDLTRRLAEEAGRRLRELALPG